MSAVRRRVMAHRSVWASIWWGGVLVIAAGILLALDEAWIAAVAMVLAGIVLMWVAGSWDLPRSRAGYLQRLRRLWNAWARETRWAKDRHRAEFATHLRSAQYLAEHERATERLIAKLRRVRAPTPVASEHEALLAALESQLAAVRELHAAMAATAPERAAAAATRWETAMGAVSDARDRIVFKLEPGSPSPRSSP